jgi:hypothetical protein
MPGLSLFARQRGTWRTNWHDGCTKSAQSTHHPRAGACQRRPMPFQQPADGPKADAYRPDTARRRAVHGVDALIGEHAKKQHGVVSIGQLRQLGLGDRAMRRRVEVASIGCIRVLLPSVTLR